MAARRPRTRTDAAVAVRAHCRSTARTLGYGQIRFLASTCRSGSKGKKRRSRSYFNNGMCFWRIAMRGKARGSRRGELDGDWPPPGNQRFWDGASRAPLLAGRPRSRDGFPPGRFIDCSVPIRLMQTPTTWRELRARCNGRDGRIATVGRTAGTGRMAGVQRLPGKAWCPPRARIDSPDGSVSQFGPS